MNPTTRRVLRWSATVVAVAFLVAAVARGWSKAADYDWHLDAGWLAGGLLVLGGFYLASALGYALILEQIAGTHVPRSAAVSIWARSLLGRYVPGNMLMVAGRLEFGRDLGISRRASLAASVYEQALALAGAAVGGVAFLLAFSDVGQGGFVWLAAVVPFGVILLHPRAFRAWSTRVLGWLGREPIEAFLSTRQVTLAFGWYLLTNAALAVGTWMCIHAAAPDAGGVAYVGLSFLLAFTISMLAFIFPAGLGVRDAAFAVALGRHLPNGVGITLAVGFRLLMALLEVAFIVLAVLAARQAQRRATATRFTDGQTPGAIRNADSSNP